MANKRCKLVKNGLAASGEFSRLLSHLAQQDSLVDQAAKLPSELTFN